MSFSKSSQGSRASRSALGSRGSQRNFKASAVDESLFAGAKAGKENNSAVVNMEEIRAIRGKAVANKDAGSAVITKAELDRIRLSCKIVTAQEKKENMTLRKAQIDQSRAGHNARKATMKGHDGLRASRLPPTQQESDDMAGVETLLTKAQTLMDEEQDDVKKMNQMVLYSKVVTIRDQQLIESKTLEAEWVREQKKLDLMMEIERLKDLQEQEDRQVRRKEAQYRGAKVIIDQIKEREGFRMREQEMREKEKLQLLANIAQQDKVENIKVANKKVQVSKMMVEVKASNAQALDLKEQKKADERLLEEGILEYQRKRREAEEEKVAEARRVAQEKENEIQRLRELQERAADRQADIDALRAKRASEENERQQRAREAKEAAHRAEVVKDLEVSRLRQFQDKESRLASQAAASRMEFLNVIARQKADEERERRLAEEKAQAMRDHAQCIRSQVVKNSDTTKQARLDYLEEGQKTRQGIENERNKILRIKQQKLDKIGEMNIDPKYQYELKNSKVSF